MKPITIAMQDNIKVFYLRLFKKIPFKLPLFLFLALFAFTVLQGMKPIVSDSDRKTSNSYQNITFPAACNASGFARVIPVRSSPQLWSDPNTWEDSLPQEGEDVLIASDKHIILDMDPPNLSGLTIDGILEFDDQPLSLSADYILIMGELHIGSESSPYTHQASITLTGNDPNENIMGMGTRGILVMGGVLEMHGNPPSVPWTKINAHAPAGTQSITLMETVDWQAGDEIVIAPTDYYGAGGNTSITKSTTLSSVNGAQLNLSNSLNAFRWGLLQYMTQTGISLVNQNPVNPPAPSGFTPTVLDQRAEVGHLTRNIVIQAPNDLLWNNQGFGCHIMIMRMGMTQGVAHINGVEIRRGGQSGILGRYPFHWHMLSYENANTLADATGQYIRNSTVNVSRHRGIVIHGTNGVEVSNNVIYHVRGHGFFTEDASERRNLISGNLVLHIRNALVPLKMHETGERGASGFWISNPDNTIINNTAADCGTNGFWLAYPAHPWGESMQVPINPRRTLFGVFDSNTAHSNRLEGIMLDFSEIDIHGNVSPASYLSTTDGQEVHWPYTNLRRFALERYVVWKNGHHGIWDRAVWVDNYECVSADNCGRFFAGSGLDGMIERCLVIGTSLNHLMNGTDRPNFTGEVPPSGFATYHSTFDIRHNIVGNFPAIEGVQSGAFATGDYYIRPVDKGLMRNIDNLMIQSHPGVKLPAQFPHFALAGALWDPHNIYSNPGQQDRYYVYNTPFFTYGQTPQIVPPDAAVSGGVIVEGPFYGFNDFVVNNANIEWEDYMQIHVERLNENMQTVGTWTVNEAGPGWILGHMRHFATHPSSVYTLDFPTIPIVHDVALSIENMLTESDEMILGVEFSGTYEVQALYTTTWSQYMDLNHGVYRHDYTPVADYDALLNASGEVYWQDTENQKVWVKIIGGLDQPWNPQDHSETDDEMLYRMFRLRIFGELSLPVELLSFSADLIDQKKVEIHWSTASEWNNDYFVVEKSTNTQNWISLDTVKGASHSSTIKQYSLIDENPLPGRSYYRLLQKDIDGKFKYSGIVSIFYHSDPILTVYPNPATDHLSLSSNAEIKDYTVRIMDASGVSYIHQKINQASAQNIDISTLQPGTYTLHVQIANTQKTFVFTKI